MPATPYRITDGIVWLDPEWSARERAILEGCVEFLLARGFDYLSIPSSLHAETYTRQQAPGPNGTLLPGLVLGEPGWRLAGSAEQGLLERFQGQQAEPGLWCARNQCFRAEARYDGLLHLREFQKVEQYCLCYREQVGERFEFLLQNALDFLDELGVDKRRVVDITESDPGYHERKLDIEVWTEAYGWMETHSCTSFGREQARRFGISGADHTLSNTGIASPRILVPLLEAAGFKID